MEITCNHCKKVLNIPDGKVPRGKAFAIPCPQCKKKISVRPQVEKPQPQKAAGAVEKKAAPDSGKTASRGSSRPPDDNIPEEDPFEFLEEGAKTAMICETNAEMRSMIRDTVEKLNFHLFEAPSPREALKQMRYHTFDLIVINELFGTRDPDMNHVLKYMSQIMMIVRRNMFVALLSERFRTNDNMTAFNKSVNMVFNIKEMDKFPKILEHSLKDHDAFYKTYKDLFTEIKGF